MTEAAIGISTIGDFISELALIQDDFEWFLTKQKQIRARLKSNQTLDDFDPITAIAYNLTTERYLPGEWRDAAAEIGLTFENCAELVAAFNYDWSPETNQGRLRQYLLHVIFPVEYVGNAPRIRVARLISTILPAGSKAATGSSAPQVRWHLQGR